MTAEVWKVESFPGCRPTSDVLNLNIIRIVMIPRQAPTSGICCTEFPKGVCRQVTNDVVAGAEHEILFLS